jgi:hypothetical protein
MIRKTPIEVRFIEDGNVLGNLPQNLGAIFFRSWDQFGGTG